MGTKHFSTRRNLFLASSVMPYWPHGINVHPTGQIRWQWQQKPLSSHGSFYIFFPGMLIRLNRTLQRGLFHQCFWRRCYSSFWSALLRSEGTRSARLVSVPVCAVPRCQLALPRLLLPRLCVRVRAAASKRGWLAVSLGPVRPHARLTLEYRSHFTGPLQRLCA